MELACDTNSSLPRGADPLAPLAPLAPLVPVVLLLSSPPHPATRRPVTAIHPMATAIRPLLKMVSRTSHSFLEARPSPCEIPTGGVTGALGEPLWLSLISGVRLPASSAAPRGEPVDDGAWSGVEIGLSAL